MAKSWFKATKARGGDSADIAIFSDIGGFGVTAQDFHNALAAIGNVSTLRVSISSDGGDVFAGFAIYNMLLKSSARVIVTVEGLAASMASVIAMAGDEVVMPENAMLMIHNPWGGVTGESEQIISFGEALAKMRAGILKAYTTRTGMKAKAIQAMMDKETWLDAKEAVSMGFADRIEKPVAMAASVNVDRFTNVPATFGRIQRKARVMNKNAKNGDEGSLELETPEVQSAKEIRDGILAQHAEIRSLCALAGKANLAEGFIGEDKTPAEVLAALDTKRKEEAAEAAKKGKGKTGTEVSARHSSTDADPAAAKSLDPTAVYANWNSAGKRKSA